MIEQTNSRRNLYYLLSLILLLLVSISISFNFTPWAWADEKEEASLLSGVIPNMQDNAKRFSREQRWDELIELTEKWYREEPNNALAAYYLGVARAKLKQYKIADIALKRAYTLSPDSIAIKEQWAAVLFELKKYEQAEKIYRSYFDEADYDSIYLLNLIESVTRQQKFSTDPSIRKEILQWFKHLYHANRLPLQINLWRNFLTLVREHHEAALLLPIILKIIKLDPNDQELWEEVANIYLAAGDTRQVLKTYEQLTLKHPHNISAKIFFAQRAVKSNNSKKAIDLYQQIAESSISTAEQKLFAYKFLLNHESKVAQLIQLHRQVILIKPNEYNSWRSLISLYKNQKNKVKVNELSNKMLQVQRYLKANPEQSVPPPELLQF